MEEENNKNDFQGYDGYKGLSKKKVTKSLDKPEESNKSVKKKPTPTAKNVEKLLEEFSQSISKKLSELSYDVRRDVSEKFNDTMLQEMKNNLCELEEQISDLKDNTSDAVKNISKLKSYNWQTVIVRWVSIILISALCSSISSYYMMKQFPQRVSLSHNKDISIHNSEVSIWGSKKTETKKVKNLRTEEIAINK